MAVGKLKAREVGDVAKARVRNKQGDNFILTVKADSELAVRFLDEPSKWTEFWQHYIDTADPRAFPCNDGDCVGCDSGDRPTKKWAARVIDVTEGKVRIFVMGKTVWEKLTGRRAFNKFHTILDRNYTIIRTGAGKNDTEYDIEAEPRSRINLEKYKAEIRKLDVEKFLLSQIPKGEMDDDEDEDDEPEFTRRKSSGRGGSAPSKRRRRVVEEDDEDEDDDSDPWDDDEEEEEEDERPARRSARKPTRKPVRKSASRTTKAPAAKPRRRINR